jgi:uncharacterized protein YukE
MVAHKDRKGPRCGAAAKPGSPRTWPCKRFALIGQARCRQHGGIHKNTEAQRQVALTNRKIDAAVRKLNITPVEDPLTELKKLAGEVLAWKNEMSRHVGQLTAIRYGGDSGEQIRGEIQLFERAMDRCAHVLTAIAKLNIDERLAAISEQQAQMLATALFAAFDEAGLTITDTIKKKAVAKAFHRHLSLVA